ncbi:MAG: diaminopimelate decarboxylase [Deltaproteobacteria bacterium HGW-Deltaproteobacteria-15]|jgi:diaminopimelate decarboxylase|nr:MAG: diaminopimelate decarboxylase [Deltaproteobacteria bacterium HGW-Deltaproteobacteria-15]
MHHFHYKESELYCEDVPIALLAQEIGTPAYIYSHATLETHFRTFDNAFKGIPHIVCFSMKSNSNLAIVRIFSRQGGGADIVSGGELYRALKAGVDPARIVYSGVGKTAEDIEYALASGILMFNAESSQEIATLNQVAGRMKKKASIAIRVNPDIDPHTHPYISTGLKENKFGIDIRKAVEQYKLAAELRHLDVCGISCHIGSQLTTVSPFVEALGKLKQLIATLRKSGISIRYLDLGGGLGITYDKEKPPHPQEYAGAVREELNMEDLTLILEPGRVIVGNAGILLTRVVYTKSSGEKEFIVVDAAMNDLIRPSLYGSFHAVQPVRTTGKEKIKADIVGPICESGDFLAKEREVQVLEAGDLAAIMSAGAYGFSMSSNYNSRPRAAEVMVSGSDYHVIRARETYEDLIRGEKIPDFLKKA